MGALHALLIIVLTSYYSSSDKVSPQTAKKYCLRKYSIVFCLYWKQKESSIRLNLNEVCYCNFSSREHKSVNFCYIWMFTVLKHWRYMYNI